jgi:hypothetical protein
VTKRGELGQLTVNAQTENCAMEVKIRHGADRALSIFDIDADQ